MVARIVAGEDFASIAVAESDGQQALQGGDLDFRAAEAVVVTWASLLGRKPSEMSPTPYSAHQMLSAVCFAMEPTSKNRSGYRAANDNKPVDPGMAAVRATTSGWRSPISTMASANAPV